MTPGLPFPTHIPTPIPTLYGHLEATQTTGQDLQQACTNRGFSLQVGLGRPAGGALEISATGSESREGGIYFLPLEIPPQWQEAIFIWHPVEL